MLVAQQQPTGATLRVSLLTQCQYDCAYCRPGSVTPASARTEWLTALEYERLARLFGELGVRKVRFTGGEPLLRPDLLPIVQAFRRALPQLELAVTTNGQRLHEMLEPLAAAGLNRATVHVDSLWPSRYRDLMGAGEVSAVLNGVVAAKQRLREVKLNVVVQRGKNDDELVDFIRWSKVNDVQVRFIELMNTGSASAYTREVFISGAEVLARLGRELTVRRVGRRNAADPAHLYEADGTVFGIIASDTAPFCVACDRLRLTADGRLRGCLYEAGGVRLGAALREGADDSTLRQLIDTTWKTKRSHHPDVESERPAFSMADTGG